MNILLGRKNWYSVTIHIDSIQNRPNSSCLTEYCSYLVDETHAIANLSKMVTFIKGFIVPSVSTRVWPLNQRVWPVWTTFFCKSIFKFGAATFCTMTLCLTTLSIITLEKDL